ncbi:hypothetical protein C8Q76DRAFT_794558 [Earliella scabrosa]|nr:hypothetical protein C8Q76DRAFT_794558 [Earliella scabrosa]
MIEVLTDPSNEHNTPVDRDGAEDGQHGEDQQDGGDQQDGEDEEDELEDSSLHEHWQDSSDDEDHVQVHRDTDAADDPAFHHWKALFSMPVERGVKEDPTECGVGSYERIILAARKLRYRPRNIETWIEGVLERKYRGLGPDARDALPRDLLRDPAARKVYVCPKKHVV